MSFHNFCDAIKRRMDMTAGRIDLEIAIHDFNPRIHDLWLKEWFLLTSGDYTKGHYNTMTVAWGYFGVMWNKPVAVVVVRPTRYTFDFINQYDSFTLSAFGKNYKMELNLLLPLFRKQR